MAIRYRITDENMQTRQGFQWKLNEWVKVSGEGGQWLHVYLSPLLAVLHNPIYGGYDNLRLFECEVSGHSDKSDGELKEGWTEVCLRKEILVPQFSTEQRVEYGIRCALEVYREKKFVKWATSWLDGTDRTAEAAETAAKEAEAGKWTWAVTWATAGAAAWAIGEPTWAVEGSVVLAAAGAVEASTGKKADLINIAMEISERDEFREYYY